MKPKKLPLPDGTVVEVTKTGSRYKAFTAEGTEVTELVRPYARRKAFDNGQALKLVATKSGGFQWRTVDKSAFQTVAEIPAPLSGIQRAETVDEPVLTHEEVVDFIKVSPLRKPAHLILPDLKWKYLVRSVARGKNILMVGPSGCGKTLAAKSIQDVMERQAFYFNLGATQDPRSTLIGNTHFAKDTGTFFAQSLFVSAIRTPNAIILLDELSRAHPDAWNILMTVLDETQRYLRLDEKADSETVKVAPGVTFIATANIGMEYTSTRQMDRALLDRFAIIEMEPLEYTQEYNLLVSMFPNVSTKTLGAIAEIATHTRDQVKSEDPKINTVISTRQSVEMASLAYDSFTLAEIAEVCIYPFFSDAGGLASERTYMKQMVQKYVSTDDESPDATPTPW